MNYAWRGRNKAGELIQGVVDARRWTPWPAQLMAGGVIYRHRRGGRRRHPGSQPNWLEALTARPIKMEDTLVFTRQLYTLQRPACPSCARWPA